MDTPQRVTKHHINGPCGEKDCRMDMCNAPNPKEDAARIRRLFKGRAVEFTQKMKLFAEDGYTSDTSAHWGLVIEELSR